VETPTLSEHGRRVQDLFSHIAHHYDLMNRLITGGQDAAWRREVIQRAAILPQARLLDLGAGTGDLAREALRQHPDCKALAADFSLGMMHRGAKRKGAILTWSAADALQLPFANATFDVVVSGFLLRNVADLQQALKEQYRVLKPGGRWTALETTRPYRHWLAPLVSFYMQRVIPHLGQIVAGERQAYTYLPKTTASFVRSEELAARLAVAGFREVAFRRFNFGTVAIHWGKK
jgi:demethylmenaquinone methyltransferase / 2-methoxy-6-polyprenyl-1,4-benzoquinol methylase